jgi:hypothetical protein
MTPAAQAAEGKSSEMAMSQTPEDAIREWLANPGLKGSDRKPLPFRVMANTIRFVKSRGGPDRQIWYVTCDANGGPRGTESWHWTVVASRDASGSWSVHGVAGGGGVGALPQRRVPWVNLGGNWGHDGFRAGGTVEDAGENVSRVRLTDAKGRAFEDTVDDGVVLFMSEEPVAMPMRVELLDAHGDVVASDEWGFLDE